MRGVTCDAVFDGLVAVASTVLGAPAASLTVAPAPGEARVKVTVDSTKPGVVVTKVVGRGTIQRASVSAVYTEDVCVAPCTFEVAPGVHEIGTYGAGTQLGSAIFDFTRPETKLHSRPVARANRWAGSCRSSRSPSALPA